MLKRFLLCLVVATVCSMSQRAFAQDLFFSFDPGALQDIAFADRGTTGSVYIFASPTFEFDAADINFTSSDSSVLQLTGGEGIDAPFDVLNTPRFNSSTITINSNSDGRWFAASISGSLGVKTALQQIDPNFVAGVGTLLARVDYDVVGSGEATLEMTLGTQGAILLGGGGTPDEFLTPTFGSAMLSSIQCLCPPGDVNLDGLVNFLDIGPFIGILSNGGFQFEADIDQNGVVNFLDISPFIGILAGN